MHALNNLLGRNVFSPRDLERQRERVKYRVELHGYISDDYDKKLYKKNPGSWCVTIAIDLLQKLKLEVRALPKKKRTTAARKAVREGKKLLILVDTGIDILHAISAKHGYIYDSAKKGPMKADRKNLRSLLPLVTHAYVIDLK